MPQPEYDRLDDLAAAVADGRVLDWDALESSATSDEERASIRRLRAIASIGQAHSELTFTDTLSESLSVRTLLATRGDTSAPTQWGPLRILERVGRGRFGDVYRAWDPSLDREVALKLLRHRDIPADADREVVEEGRLMARVHHPNVVTIHGAQRIDGRTGLWMEFVEGRTLEAELKERGPLPANEVAQVGIELCRALGAVHDAGLVHRDVKAQNVLRDKRGRIVLGDFGTGRELDDEGVGPTSIAGTPAYLAPEIFKGAAATPQSDIYSLGVLLFRVATGSYPVVGRSITQIRDAHENKSRTSITALRSDLPASLADVIERATDAHSSRRFQSALAMETALAAALQRTEATSSLRTYVLGGAIAVVVAAGALWSLAGQGDGNSVGGPGTPSQAAQIGGRVFRYVGGADLAGPGRPSPDGRLLSMVLDGELGLHEVATGKRWKLTGEQSGDPPGWVEHSQFSLDGSRITYLRFIPMSNPSDGAIPQIRNIATNGGRSRLIWKGEDTRSVNLYHWAGNDDLVLLARWPEQGRGELLIIDTVNGLIRASHELPTAPSLTGASLSPDGRYVAFEQTDRSTGRSDIDLWNVDPDTVAPLIRELANDSSPVWSADGKHLLFMSNRSGPTGLWAQPMEDGRAVGTPVRIDPDIGTGAPMGGLTNAGALFMRRDIGTRDVVAVDIDPVTLRPLSDPKRVTDDPRSATGQSAWSPDSTQLAFFRRDGLRRSLVVHSMTDGREREYWRPEIQGYAMPRWAPDGRSIFFKGSLDDQGGLIRLDPQTGAVTMVLNRFINHYEPLPGGNVIVLSDRGKREIVRVDLTSGHEEVLQRLQPPSTPDVIALSHGGDRLLYSTRLAGKSGMAVRVLDLAAPTYVREIFRTPPGSIVVAYDWSANDREVIVERDINSGGIDDNKAHLWAIDVATGHARPIGLTDPRGLHDLRSSPDGRQLSYDSGWPYQEVWVLENAAAGLPH